MIDFLRGISHDFEMDRNIMSSCCNFLLIFFAVIIFCVYFIKFAAVLLQDDFLLQDVEKKIFF